MEPGIDTVVSEAYVTGLSDLSLDEVRARREAARHLENAVSYVRRLAHGRLDIIAAEIGRRDESGDALDLVSTLRASLGGGASVPSGAELGLPIRAPQQLDPAEAADPFVADLDAAVSAGFIADIGESSDRELDEALGRLKVFEESISARRRSLHATLDQLQAELVRRYRDEGVDVDTVLGS